MGTGTFFSKIASVDPLAHALHLPGANKYAQVEATKDAGQSAANGQAYTGVAPTLAAANAGYAAGGPGSNADWHPWTPNAPGGIFGAAQRVSSAVGGTTPDPYDGRLTPQNPGQLVNTAQTAPGYTPTPTTGAAMNYGQQLAQQSKRTTAQPSVWGS